MCRDENIRGAIVNIDFEKAFDTVEWDHLYKALASLRLPSKLIDWIKTLYHDIETCIINNGHTSRYFQPERGVRQGCPLSPYLFILTMEPLNRWIKEKLDEYSLQDNKGNKYIISQFADDTSFAIKEGKKGISELFEILDTYSRISGLKINIDKTEILLLGGMKKEMVPKRYRKYIKESVSYLGLEISTDTKQTTEVNLNNAVVKIQNLIRTWNKRKIPLSGKVAIIKSLMVPQLTYVLSTLATPSEKKIKEINKMLYKFLNSGGNEKIKRNILISDYGKGGFKMCDLESHLASTKIRWMERLLNTEGLWKQPVINKIRAPVALLSRCNIKYEDLPFRFNKTHIWN
jgi:hypothetical protein